MQEIPNKFRVCVRCNTYNQAAFITETMNGFSIQETTFPYICFIIDDASTDGEQNVIKDYVNENFNILELPDGISGDTDGAITVFARHKSNANCYFWVILLKKNLYEVSRKKLDFISYYRNECDFEAYCEGDDYWTHPEKLQMQYYILENNNNVGLVYTQAKKYYNTNQTYKGDLAGYYTRYEDIMLRAFRVATLSIVYRLDLYGNYLEATANDRKWDIGDIPFVLYMMKHSDVVFIPMITGVYRILPESACHSKSAYKKQILKISLYYTYALYAKRYWSKTLRKDLKKQMRMYERITASDYQKYFYLTCPLYQYTYNTWLFIRLLQLWIKEKIDKRICKK